MDSLNHRKQSGAEIATTTEQQSSEQAASHPSDGPLKGEEALGLYLSEIGCNMMALGAQSALLLSAMKEQVKLLHKLHAAQSRPHVSSEDRRESEPDHAEGGAPGAQPE